MVGDQNCLKYCVFACFLYCNRQVHRDFLITLYYHLLSGFIIHFVWTGTYGINMNTSKVRGKIIILACI